MIILMLTLADINSAMSPSTATGAVWLSSPPISSGYAVSNKKRVFIMMNLEEERKLAHPKVLHAYQF